VVGTPDDPPEAVLPTGGPVRVVLTSPDVIHSFYVPEFLFKRDAIPGRTTSFDLTIERPGIYRGRCAEFCGLDHWRMRFTIRAVSPTEFEAWLAGQAR
jgi:cytochrome c oxidase subunit 2